MSQHDVLDQRGLKLNRFSVMVEWFCAYLTYGRGTAITLKGQAEMCQGFTGGFMSTFGMMSKPGKRRVVANFTWLWAITLLTLAICVLALVWFPVLRIGSLPAINYNEGWNAYRDRMAADGLPLYGSPPHLWITNYPFLSFHIIGLLGKTIGSMIVAGRIMALGALAAICVMIACIVRSATGAWRDGFYAGLCFFLWVATLTPDRVAMNDPDLLGAAITLFGVCAYLRAPANLPWLVVSAIAFAVGVFTKQDVIALPLGVGLHLTATRNWRGLALWVTAGAVATGLLLFATFRLDGPYFFAHLLRPRFYSVRQGVQSGTEYSARFCAPLILCAVVLFRDRTIRLRGFFLVLLVLANAIAFVFVGGDGVALNIFYVPLIAAAAASGIAVCSLERALFSAPWFSAPWARTAMAVALAIPALPGVALAPGQFHADLMAQRDLPALTEAAQHAVAILKRLPGPAICQNILLCYEAGKPLGFDTFFVKDQAEIGRLKEADILAMLVSHRYAAIQLYSAAAPPFGAHAKHSQFFKAFMRTLRASYKPALTGRINSVFVPRRRPFPADGPAAKPASL